MNNEMLFFFYPFKPEPCRAPAALLSAWQPQHLREAGGGSGLQPLDPCVDQLRYLMRR